MNTRKQRFFIVVIIALVAGLAPVVFAGDLNPPAGPNAAGSAMFSIEDLYQRLDAGTPGTKRGGTPGTFKEPAAAPGSTMHSLNDVMEKAPVKDDANGASADQVLTGKKFWGLKDGAGWGLLAGTMPMTAITAASTEVNGGYIATTTLTAIDADLTSANIKAGTTIFGVPGAIAGGRVIDPAWASSPLGIWRNTGDGILDTRTGLIWRAVSAWTGGTNYEKSVEMIESPWRLPTIDEYQTLVAGPETAAESGFFPAFFITNHWSATGNGPAAGVHVFNPVTGSRTLSPVTSPYVRFHQVR